MSIHTILWSEGHLPQKARYPPAVPDMIAVAKMPLMGCQVLSWFCVAGANLLEWKDVTISIRLRDKREVLSGPVCTSSVVSIPIIIWSPASIQVRSKELRSLSKAAIRFILRCSEFK